VLLTSAFPPPRAEPPGWTSRYAAAGIALGICFVLLGHGRLRALRIALDGLYLVLGASLGLLGSALCYLTFFSAHSAAASNYNVLLLPPWLLALCVAGVQVLRGKAAGFRLAHWAALGALGSSLLAAVLHVLSRHPQANLQELAATLPLWLGVTLSAWQTDSSRESRHAQRAAST